MSGDTLAAACGAWARRSPSAPALVSATGEVMTYAELAAYVAELSRWLAGFVAAQQVTAVIAGNGPTALPVIAAAASSSICAPLPPDQTVTERVAQLKRLGASLLLAVAGETAADEIAARQAGIPMVRLADPALPPSGGPRCAIEPRPALLVHTSGSTGAGKLVPLTTTALLHAASLVASTLGLSPGDRGLNVMPLHHTHGLVGSVLASLASGGSVICLPQYSDDGLRKAFNRFGPTWYTAVPAIHARVAALAEAGRLGGHRLRFARSASAPLTGQLRRRLQSALCVPVLQAYALTEAPGQACAHRPADQVDDGSVGRAHGCEVMVLGEAPGEILVRGPHVALGYLSGVEGTLVPHPDGWLRTGDLGRLTADGELFLEGRRDDVINRAGEKVLPGEIENVIAEHPKVRDVVVLGVTDPVLGEAIAGLVVGDVDEDELRSFALGTLSHSRVPDHVLFTGQIPRSPTGKVNRRELGADLVTRLSARGNPDDDLVSAVAEIWSHVLFLPGLDPDADFTEVGGGSLQSARIEALVAQRFGVRMPPAATLEEASTVRRMAKLITARTRGYGT